jgi:hypothetical protein
VRNVCLALLFANLAYFAWAAWVDVPRPPPVNEAAARLPRLKLVSELPPSERPATNTPTALNSAGACLSVGPFGDINNAARAAGVLRSKGFDPRQRAEAGETSAGYWVYVGGIRSQVDADRVRVSLERSGMKDALVMPVTAGERRISLGLFSDKAHAEQRAAAVKRLGFKAEVAEHRLPQTLYWVDLAPRPGMTTVPLEGLFAEGVGSHIAVQPCPPPPVSAPAAAAAAVQQASTVAAPAPVSAGGTPKLP